MRKGRREVLLLLVVFLAGTMARAARYEKGKPAAGSEELLGITVELSWTAPGGEARGLPRAALPAPELRLGVTEGVVSEVVSWPPEFSAQDGPRPRLGPDGDWRLGPGGTGRVRARLEVSPGADLVVRRGEHVVRIPVVAVLERPQRTPSQSPLTVSVERLPWDSLIVDLGPGAADGIVAPGVAVPVVVKYNILSPETADVMVRTTAVLRPMGGDEALWRHEQRELVPANRLDPPPRAWTVPAPGVEGSYVLEIHAAWEPAGVRDGTSTRLGRLLRRRKASPVANSATRRVVLAVVSPNGQGGSQTAFAAGLESPGRETEVDSLDLNRIRSSRFSAWGRSPVLKPGGTVWGLPAEIFLDAGRKERELDRLRNWIARTATEVSNLGPADDSGLAWSAVGLRVTHPDKPHRLTVTVAGGDPSALGVALVDPGGGGKSPRVLLDACVTGPPILKEGPPASFSWLVWPDTPEPQLLLLNRNSSGSVRLGSVRLTELEKVPPSPPVRLPKTPATRTMGLFLTGQHPLDRFGGAGETGLTDNLEVARNLVSYLTFCSASLVVLPERLSDRQVRRGLKGQAEENSTGPDQLDLVLRLLHRQGYSAWLELNMEGKGGLPGLPPPDSADALRMGLVRVDRQGLADGPSYHPLHPDVRQAMRRRVEQALAPRQGGATFSGILLQLGPGPTLLGNPDTGLDDDTFSRFVHDTFGPETAAGIPGLGTADPSRFATRSKYLSGVGRMPWLMWRSRAIAALYSELDEAARAASPGTVMALSTPALHGGAAGAEARRVDLAGLAPSQAWRSVGLDLQAWPTGPNVPILLRGVELSTDPLAHDLATSPDLDARIASRPHRGVLLTIDPEPVDPAPGPGSRAPAGEGSGDAAAEAARAGEGGSHDLTDARRGSSEPLGGALTLSALPLGDGLAADEPLGHALAALDAQWVILAVPAIAGHEERLRRFASVLRALPAWPAQPLLAGGDQKDYGIAVRALSDQTQTYFEIANDTPYPIRLAGLLDAPAPASVEDLGRNLRLVPQAVTGGRQLVIDLLPYGVSAIRVGAAKAQLTDITPYPSDAVLTSMEAQYHELSNQLARLNRGSGSGIGEPPNPGFEPAPPPPVQPAHNTPGDQAATPEPGQLPGGWKLEGGRDCSIAIDASNPHSGQGSLKLTAPVAPVSVASGDFVPTSASSMMIQAYFRTEPPDSQVRLWVQGEVGGQPYLRRSEFKVSSAWELKAVRAIDLPAGGLDSARLRFEMLTPGTLWIDDLHVVGEAAPKAVRLNAQRTLLAALQAYRAQRYAEFARLAGSHWARHPGILAASRQSRPAELSEMSGPSRSGPAAASALSPDRRVR
jgi:hypothetical protein